MRSFHNENRKHSHCQGQWIAGCLKLVPCATSTPKLQWTIFQLLHVHLLILGIPPVEELWKWGELAGNGRGSRIKHTYEQVQQSQAVVEYCPNLDVNILNIEMLTSHGKTLKLCCFATGRQVSEIWHLSRVQRQHTRPCLPGRCSPSSGNFEQNVRVWHATLRFICVLQSESLSIFTSSFWLVSPCFVRCPNDKGSLVDAFCKWNTLIW